MQPRSENEPKTKANNQKTGKIKGHILPRHIDFTDLLSGVVSLVLVTLGGYYPDFRHWIFSGLIVASIGLHLHYRHKTKLKRNQITGF